MDGSRGRIGLITLATDDGVLPELSRLLPAGVTLYPAPIAPGGHPLPRGEVTPAAPGERLAGDVLAQEQAARLRTGIGPDLIVVPDVIPGYGRLLTLTDRPAAMPRPLEAIST